MWKLCDILSLWRCSLSVTPVFFTYLHTDATASLQSLNLTLTFSLDIQKHVNLTYTYTYKQHIITQHRVRPSPTERNESFRSEQIESWIDESGRRADLSSGLRRKVRCVTAQGEDQASDACQCV